MIRIMRSNLLDEMRKPYVMTARARGLSETRVILSIPYGWPSTHLSAPLATVPLYCLGQYHCFDGVELYQPSARCCSRR
jgi:hypothetical protein